MKKYWIKSQLQNLFGFKTYLLVYSLYGIRRTLQGKYEVDFSYFMSLIPDRGIVLDIGANVGMTAVPVAKLKRNIDLHAFEPIKENFSTLKKVISLYRLKNTRLFNMALGDTPGTVEMIMPFRHRARQQGLCKVYQGGSQEVGIKYSVPMDTLDNVYREGQNITAMKIDVENFEYEVLLGATKLLKRCLPIIYCELWKNEKRRAVFDYLRKIGYSAFVYNEKKSRLTPIKSENLGDSYNFIFLPQTFAKADMQDKAVL